VRGKLTLLSGLYFQAGDCIRDDHVTGVRPVALPISLAPVRFGSQRAGSRLRGGAVSGAGPCALTAEANRSERNNRATLANRPKKYGFRVLTNASSSGNAYAKAHECIKPRTDWRTE